MRIDGCGVLHAEERLDLEEVRGGEELEACGRGVVRVGEGRRYLRLGVVELQDCSRSFAADRLRKGSSMWWSCSGGWRLKCCC